MRDALLRKVLVYQSMQPTGILPPKYQTQRFKMQPNTPMVGKLEPNQIRYKLSNKIGLKKKPEYKISSETFEISRTNEVGGGDIESQVPTQKKRRNLDAIISNEKEDQQFQKLVLDSQTEK